MSFTMKLSSSVFEGKYKHGNGCETWPGLARVCARDVCEGLLDKPSLQNVENMIAEMRFLPGGRYLYYAGRQCRFWNNCALLRCEEDTREDWAELARKATSCLMTGMGIGSDYSIYREKGRVLSRTGGISSGPIPAMEMVNEIGRRVQQGGSRRSAIYASLNWAHPDAKDFLHAKDWHNMKVPGTNITYGQAKMAYFDFPCPLDYTNISLNYDDAWLNKGDRHLDKTFLTNVRQACMTGEPGFSFNFGSKSNETLRNACTEITSEDDSDICNLGSINMARISTIDEFAHCVYFAIGFLMCGTVRADVPYEKMAQIRAKNRRLGLGLMGVHEWLLQRGYRYGMNPELRQWMESYREVSDLAAKDWAETLGVSVPVATRAIAPTGSIGILAETTTGIEPIYAVAMKRRFQKDGQHKFICEIDPVAKKMKDRYGVDLKKIETASDLAKDPERRIKFQAEMQEYVDHGISSTVNLPRWGSEDNNEKTVEKIATIISIYAPKLRGITCYPDAARGGQPLNAISVDEAESFEGEQVENSVDICSLTKAGASCGS